MENRTKELPEPAAKSEKPMIIRVTAKTRRLLTEILEKANGKERGRTIKADEVIGLALSLVTTTQIKQLQDASLSNTDRLEMTYQKYIRENAYMSKDEWIGRLLKAERHIDAK